MDNGKPPDVNRQPAQCVHEALVIYGIPAGGQPSRSTVNGLEVPHSGLFDHITAWMFRFRNGTQIILSHGHRVHTFEVPMESQVLARLRLKAGELLQEITIYTSASDLDRMQMIDVDEGDQGLAYLGALCSALRVGTTTKRSLTKGRVMEMEETSPNEGAPLLLEWSCMG